MPDLSLKSEKSAGRRIAANASLIAVAKLISMGLGLVTLVIAAAHLNVNAFGTLIFIHAYMLFFAEVTTFKTWQAIIRFGAEDLEAGNATRLSRLFKFSIKIDALSVVVAYILSLAIMAVAIIAAEHRADLPLADNIDLKALQKTVALYCLVILLRQNGTSTGVLRLFDRFDLLAIRTLVTPVVRLIGASYVAWAGYGFTGFLLVWFAASALSYVCNIVLAVTELKKRGLLGSVIRARQNFFKPRAGLWSFVIKSNIDSSINGASSHLPQLLVMAVFGAAWSGVFKVAYEISKLLAGAFKLLDQVIYPELAKMVSRRQTNAIWRLTIRAALIMFSVSLLFALGLVLAGPDLLTSVFGQSYKQAAPLAALLVAAAALLAFITPLYPIFYAVDKPERAIQVRLAALLVYIAAFFMLTPILGQMTPGWAAIIGNLFASVIIIFYTRSTLKTVILAENSPPK